MSQHKGRLLIVDDEPMNLDMLSRRLQRSGFQVDVAGGGREAMEKISKQTFDLILLDQMMPEMGGSEVLRLLRLSYSPQALPIIMVTAVAESEQIADALEHGANDYITKPIDYRVGLARILSALERRSAERDLRRSEERYALAARASRDGLWDWDLKSDRIYYSPRWQEMLGLHLTELNASPDIWFSRIVGADQAACREKIHQHLTTHHDVLHLDYRVQREDGSVRWMSCRGVVARDESGKAIRIAGSQSDVTEERTCDALTGLGNRTLMLGQLELLLDERTRQPDLAYALMFLDLDGFKTINDSLGHLAGDQLLQQIGQRLAAALADAAASLTGKKITIARMGGDEFAILVSGLQLSEDQARIAALAVKKCVRLPFQIGERTIHCSFSVGVALQESTHARPEDVLRDADVAMYASKVRGLGEVVFFTPEMHQAMLTRLDLENDLRQALERHEFFLSYQPIVDLQTGLMSGVEALVRWKHPSRGVLEPGLFIPIAEQTGLILELGQWILRQACFEVRRLQMSHPDRRALQLSVNLSPMEFKQPDLVDLVRGTLQETGFPAGQLHLEITEGVLFEDIASARQTIQDLNGLGVMLDLDDFGAGHSSLRYLRDMPFHCLKIDRTFIANMSALDVTSTELVQTILGLAASLKMKVVAEGIETAPHRNRLQQMGCMYGQGYFFSRPINLQDLETLLQNEALGPNTSSMLERPGIPLPNPLPLGPELVCG